MNPEIMDLLNSIVLLLINPVGTKHLLVQFKGNERKASRIFKTIGPCTITQQSNLENAQLIAIHYAEAEDAKKALELQKFVRTLEEEGVSTDNTSQATEGPKEEKEEIQKSILGEGPFKIIKLSYQPDRKVCVQYQGDAKLAESSFRGIGPANIIESHENSFTIEYQMVRHAQKALMMISTPMYAKYEENKPDNTQKPQGPENNRTSSKYPHTPTKPRIHNAQKSVKSSELQHNIMTKLQLISDTTLMVKYTGPSHKLAPYFHRIGPCTFDEVSSTAGLMEAKIKYRTPEEAEKALEIKDYKFYQPNASIPNIRTTSSAPQQVRPNVSSKNQRYDDTAGIRLCVQIPLGVTEDEYIQEFMQFGPIDNIIAVLMKHQEHEKNPKYMGFVAYFTEEDAKRAMRSCNTKYAPAWATPGRLAEGVRNHRKEHSVCKRNVDARKWGEHLKICRIQNGDQQLEHKACKTLVQYKNWDLHITFCNKNNIIKKPEQKNTYKKMDEGKQDLISLLEEEQQITSLLDQSITGNEYLASPLIPMDPREEEDDIFDRLSQISLSTTTSF